MLSLSAGEGLVAEGLNTGKNEALWTADGGRGGRTERNSFFCDDSLAGVVEVEETTTLVGFGGDCSTDTASFTTSFSTQMVSI